MTFHFSNLSSWLACSCSTAGSVSSACHQQTGKCTCEPNYTGPKCDRCQPGHYGYPNCQRCDCDAQGSIGSACDSLTGQCSCKSIYTGRQCNLCLPGFYGFPNCRRCSCNPAGTKPNDDTGYGDCSTSRDVGFLCVVLCQCTIIDVLS